MNSRPSHTRNKTGNKVRVERVGDPPNILFVVYSMNGKAIGSYEKTDMAKFRKRYTPLPPSKKRV